MSFELRENYQNYIVGLFLQYQLSTLKMNPKDNIKKEKRVQARKPVISSACNLPEVRRHLDKNFGCSLLVLKEMEILISAQDLNFT